MHIFLCVFYHNWLFFSSSILRINIALPLASQAVEGVEQVTFYQGRVGGARLSIAHTSKSHPPLISSITTTTISSAIFCMVGGRNFQSQSLHCTMCTLYSHVPQGIFCSPGRIHWGIILPQYTLQVVDTGAHICPRS